MASEFKKQIEEWMKRREEKNRPEIKDTTHSTDPGRLIPEEREEEDHNFYSRKIKEYALRRADELAVNKTEELDKGAKGDWEKEGYSLKYLGSETEYNKKQPDFTVHTIKAYDNNGNEAGTYDFVEHHASKQYQGQIFPNNVHTKEKHQRKGLANAAYKMLEDITDKKLSRPIGEGSQSDSAKTLWSQPNKPFGGKNEVK